MLYAKYSEYAPNCTLHKPPFFNTVPAIGYTMTSNVNDNDIMELLSHSVSERDFIISNGKLEVDNTDNLSNQSIDEIDVNM